jgi:hypothetical protein
MSTEDIAVSVEVLTVPEPVAVAEPVAEVAAEPAPETATPPSTPEPAAAPAAPAAPAPGLFGTIDWKNPFPTVVKLATHLYGIEALTPAERLTMLQGSLYHAINSSKISTTEKETARLFVDTMVPHIVETAVAGIEAAAKVASAEKKARDLIDSAMSKQPKIIVKNLETVLADAAKSKWWCCW